MKEVELAKDWLIRAGVLVPKGTKIQLEQVFIDQLTKEGFIKQSKNQKSQ